MGKKNLSPEEIAKAKVKADRKKVAEAEKLDYLQFLQRNIGDKYNVVITSEFKFHPVRKWRFDYFIPVGDAGIAIEIDGGIWIGGRHTSPQGFVKDMEKFNNASSMGYYVFKFTPSNKKSKEQLDLVNILLDKLINNNQNEDN